MQQSAFAVTGLSNFAGRLIPAVAERPGLLYLSHDFGTIRMVDPTTDDRFRQVADEHITGTGIFTEPEENK